jgi:transcriptional regulator GlxA family with amidase domain
MSPPKRTVAFVAFDGLQVLDIVGPAEVFDAATQLLGGAGGYRIVVATPGGRAVHGAAGLRLGAHAALGTLPAKGLDTVVVGGGLAFESAIGDVRVTDAVRRLSSGARRTCSICTGAFLLADAGLLDGRRATTHWAFATDLARRYPQVDVEPDRIYVRDGAITTSAGVTAGIDLALALVEDDHGAELARTVARWLVVFLQRPGGQSQFSERLQVPVAADSPVRALVDDIVARPRDDHRQSQLARRAALSERHLRRVFAEETGTTPGRFVERVRVEAARELLEAGATPIETVAARCGFGSTETMRRAFLRVLGVGPADYRQRFRSSTRQAA